MNSVVHDESRETGMIEIRRRLFGLVRNQPTNL